MKQIIIFLLLIIVGILGYNTYSKYKRFNPPGSTYQAPANIDLNYYNQEVVADYHQAVAKVNGHVAQMWSFHSIDVRAPKRDVEATKAAVATYEELMAKLKGLETKLQESARLKEAGMNNVQIEAKEMGLDTAKASLKSKKEMLLGWLETAPADFEFGIGSEGPLVYELQGILIKMGYEMEHDGIFQLATSNAVESFETKNGFYADGRMDPLTAYALLAN